MTSIASRPSLLHAAIQDLHAGKLDAAKRLPTLADGARDEALATLLREEAARAGAHAARLAGLGATADGPANLWMRGILDDAERDTRQTEPGRLLDIALIGAVRKAKAAEIVSSETAIALAAAIGDAGARAAIEANWRDEIACDEGLKRRLDALA